MTHFLADFIQYPFLQRAVIAVFLASVASGIVGSIVVVRRSTYIAGAISHCVLGGMGIARYMQVVHGIKWLTPITGAIISAILVAILIGWATLNNKYRIDSILSIVWALGMAIGITFIMITPGYGQDLTSYLFGNILMVSHNDILLMFFLDVFILVAVVLFYNKILAVCFNEESAMLRGIPVFFYNMFMLIIIALTTVLLVQVVGIVLVIALLTIPAVTVSPYTKKLSTMMIATFLICFAESAFGIILSYEPELPVGATIIELSGTVFILQAMARAIITKKN